MVVQSDLAKFLQILEEAYPNHDRPIDNISMTTPRELAFCELYARHHFTGEGVIYDLGTWFGATAAAFGRGLEARNYPISGSKPVLSRDLFVWQAWMANTPLFLGTVKGADAAAAGLDYQPGDSFLPAVKTRLARWLPWIDLAAADLTMIGPEAEFTELLFVDAMKSWDLANAILHRNLSTLIPGRSLVVQQDYAFYGRTVPANVLIMWHLRDKLEWIHHVPDSCSVVFRSVSPIEPGELPHYSSELFTKVDARAAFAHGLRCVRPESARCVLLCQFLYWLERAWWSEAAELWEQLRSQLPKLLHPVMKRVLAREANETVRRQLPATIAAEIASLTMGA